MGRLGTNNFGGGINNWETPWNIDSSQCVDLLNAKVDSRSIVSARGHAVTTDLPDIAAYIDAATSAFKFSGEWFWSDNENGGIDSTLGYIGVLPPASSPVAALSIPGKRFSGTYRYACTYETADGYESCAYFDGYDLGRKDCEVNAACVVEHSDPIVYPLFDIARKSLSQPNNPQAVGYEVGVRVNMTDGTSWECTQTLVANKSLTLAGWQRQGKAPGAGTKFWREVSATELTVDSTGYDIIELTLPQPTQSIITQINIYRTIKNGADLYLLASVPVGTSTYLDSVEDLQLLSREPYSAEPALGPIYVREGAEWAQKDGKYLTSLAGVFYLAYGDRLYISEQDNPHAWNPAKYLIFDDDITAIGLAGSEAVLVVTKNRAYRVTGTTIADLVKEDLKATQGCPNWRTLTYFRNQPVWMSYDGLCGYTPAESRDSSFVTILTEKRYRFLTQPNFGVTANDTYYAFYDDHAVCFDFRGGLSIYRLEVTAEYGLYDPDSDRLLFYRAGNWYQLEGGSSLEFSYTSPELTGGGLHGNRHWRQLWLNSDCDLTVTPCIDGETKTPFTVSGSGRRSHFLAAGMFGSRLQLTIEGTGTFRSYEVEVTPLNDKIAG